MKILFVEVNVGTQLFVLVHLSDADRTVSEVGCSEHARAEGGLRNLFLCFLSSVRTYTLTLFRKRDLRNQNVCTAPCRARGWNNCYTVHYEIPTFFGVSFWKFFIAQRSIRKSLSRRKKKFETNLLFLLSAEISCWLAQKKRK